MKRAAALMLVLPLAGFAAEPARFAGILPCADCPAMLIELTLSKDGSNAPSTYRQRTTYVDRRGKDLAFVTQGRWSIVREREATFYRLVDPKSGERQHLKVDGERALRIVDEDGRDFDSPIPQVLWRRSAGAKRATIGKPDAGSTVRLSAGEEVVVRLPSNPSTGYRWSLASEPAQPIVAISATPAYKRDPGAGQRAGAPGTETWRLFAFRPGTQQVSFEYRRSWERDPAPADTFAFTVEVR
jgi:predicted secreted protein